MGKGTILCKLRAFWQKIKPGLFSKIIVIFCLGYSVRIVEWGMRQFEQSNTEAATLLTVSLALFGGELLFLCLKRVFAKPNNTASDGPRSYEDMAA